jgi:hypothetical protein
MTDQQWLTTRDCAVRLGVATDFIVGEIRDGRLVGRVLTRTTGRTLYRVERPDFEAYIARHWRKDPAA